MTPALLAIAALLAITLGYVATCAASPFGTCRTCRGMGHQIKQDRKGHLKRGKDCRRCKGHGKRIRIGRRLYNRATAVHRAGTR
ncbi:hypothetical protein [Streptomyces sp. bgisy060]|uniref:hypothetical protein n=1 Tax=Streptomyces sp. bgisy060 TaxID=3413775 RepID=UPI003EC131C4